MYRIDNHSLAWYRMAEYLREADQQRLAAVVARASAKSRADRRLGVRVRGFVEDLTSSVRPRSITAAMRTDGCLTGAACSDAHHG